MLWAPFFWKKGVVEQTLITISLIAFSIEFCCLEVRLRIIVPKTPIEDRIISKSTDTIPHLRTPKLTRETISKDDMAALLTAPPATKKGKRDQLILVLLYDSAIRVSELLDLDVRSMNPQTNSYWTLSTKYDNVNIVPLKSLFVTFNRAYNRRTHPRFVPSFV